MELRHFRYFVAVAEHSSFTGAAARLYVAQPTLSQQIKNLERELGVTLLERRPGGVRPTAAGAVFYDHCLRILAAVDEAVEATRRAVPEAAHLRVGLTGPLPDSIHLPVLSAFAAAFPQVRLQCVELALPGYDQGLINGDVDVALLRSPLDTERVIGQPIVTGEVCGLAVPMGHPLWDADAVDIADVLAEPLPNLAPAISARIRSHYLLYGERNGVAPRFVGDPVATGADIVLAVGLQGLVCPVSIEVIRGGPISRVKALELRGGPLTTTYAARRIDDLRILPAAFCDLAGRVAAELSAQRDRVR